MTPDQFLKQSVKMADNLKALKKSAVFVGLPNEKVGGKVYGDGRSVLSVGAVHEFGAPQQGIPMRSFLRAPFHIKRKPLNKAIADQYEAVTIDGLNPKIGLGRIGIIATNISKGAFTSLGYGQWNEISEETKQRKGSSQTLIDTGVLRSSITHVVRDN